MPKPDRWGCPVCKTINDIGQYVCSECNHYRGVAKITGTDRGPREGRLGLKPDPNRDELKRG